VSRRTWHHILTLTPVSNGAYIGEIIGLQLTGYAVAKFGNKKVMGGATVMMIAFVRRIIHVLLSKLTLSDLHLFLWKVARCPASRSDPLWYPVGSVPDRYYCVRIRGLARQPPRIPHLVSIRDSFGTGLTCRYVNLCWVIGQFIASGVLVGVQDRTDEWGWR